MFSDPFKWVTGVPVYINDKVQPNKVVATFTIGGRLESIDVGDPETLNKLREAVNNYKPEAGAT